MRRPILPVLLICAALIALPVLTAARQGDGKLRDGKAVTIGLTGAVEVPGPGDPDGSGTARLTLKHEKGEVCYDIKASKVQTVTAAHIHQAPAGQAGPPKVIMTANAGKWKGCVSAEKEVIHDIMQNPANYYVNVHNEEFKDGALRGQLGK